MFGPLGMGSSARYADVALSAPAFTESPWGYRVMVPWLARSLSEFQLLGLYRAFEAIQFVAYTVCALLLVHAGRMSGAPRLLSLLSVLGWTIGYQFVYARHNYVHVGFVEFATLGWAIWLFYRQRFLPSLALLVLSVLVKETIAYVALPALCIYYAMETASARSRPFSPGQLAALVLIPATLFFALRSSHGPGFVAGHLVFYGPEFFSEVFGPALPGRIVDFHTTFGILLMLLPMAFSHASNDCLLQLCLIVPVAALAQLAVALDPRLVASLAMPTTFILALRLAGAHAEWRFVRNVLTLNVVFGIGWLSQTYPIAILASLMGIALMLGRLGIGSRRPTADR